MKNTKIINTIWGIIAFIAFIFILLFYFTIITDDTNEIVNILKNSNEIGDAIGGISAPFIGLTAVVLTYKAFRVQYDFNEKQLDFNKQQTLFLKNEKLDRKVDEYNKLLDSIIANDVYKDIDVRFILSYSTTKTINNVISRTKINGNSINQIISFNYVKYYKAYTLLDIDGNDDTTNKVNQIDKEKLKLYESQIEIILDVYSKLYSFLRAFVEELKINEIKENEIERLLFSYFTKIEMLYHNYDDFLFCIVIKYFVEVRKSSQIYTSIDRSIISAVNSYFLDLINMNEIDDVVHYFVQLNNIKFSNLQTSQQNPSN